VVYQIPSGGFVLCKACRLAFCCAAAYSQFVGHRDGRGHGVTGPAWVTALLAVLMLLIAAASVVRLAMWRLSGRDAEPEADTLHVFMGTAMAGMLEPRFGLLPDKVWEAVFAAAAAWFAWRTIRERVGRHRASRAGHTGGAGCMQPAAHSVECGAMIYMLVPGEAAGHRSAMPGMGMGGTSGSAANPALALIFVLFMVGYIFWIADRLANQSRSKSVGLSGRVEGEQQADGPDGRGTNAGTLAPRLAACSKIAMSFAMGYMLLMTV
jgi:Domain of unknown function (DUF5134)